MVELKMAEVITNCFLFFPYLNRLTPERDPTFQIKIQGWVQQQKTLSLPQIS